MMPRSGQLALQASAAMMMQRRQTRPSPVIPHNTPNVEQEMLCNYSQYLCRREKVSGHDFCIRHILEDKNSAYKQCNFQFRNHRRCPKPAPKSDRKDGFCLEHSRKAMAARQKALRKRPAQDATHRLLADLGHHKKAKVDVKAETPKQPKCESPGEFEDLEKDITPFQISSESTRIPSPPPSRLFDVASDAESDGDSITVDSAWCDDDDSDADSIDSEMEHPLKYAGAYSAEEVIRIMRDKLIRLQKLYIDQFQRLQYLLREERRQYRVSLRKEHEAELASIHRQPKETADDRAAYEHLKSLNHYNKPAGLEAVLHAKLMERRVKLGESAAATAAGPAAGGSLGIQPAGKCAPSKCSYNITSSTKCGDICVPLTKFCQRHVLNDANQVLFRKCGFVVTPVEGEDEDGPCETTIGDVFEASTCVYHTQFQPPFPASSVELMDHKREEAVFMQAASGGQSRQHHGPL